MRINIFQATGDEQIAGIEAEINGWVERTEGMGFSVKIMHCSTAMCQIDYGPDTERLPQLAITFWYELAPRI